MNFLLNYFIPHAHAYNYFDLGDVASSTLAYAGGVIDDLKPVWLMVLGVLLGMIVISFVVGMLTKHK
jgi:hypothetical protein